ncbi:DUF4099 domain-containing protein [Mucilaginibacter paludis]|uniref:DUF4099 domain-containing protein n=1 Tax=Mucilaginibacter paludis DSM 18603 TaxID=714943 RepID=H1YI47_9SPHI|nr:DUF4099 domain-containing protein [Mucilaginibacter paludis]EHQ26482.1 hypothetical protein Mucpa_2352 [Mucilaginibacter paludis DSM 18603]
MIQQIFNEDELPMADLEKIGLASGGHLSLETEDLQALVSGRRTNMLRLKNLSGDGLQIPELDAKLSLKPNESGNLDLLVHPIYREPQFPDFLTDTEAEELERGQAVSIWKLVKDENNQTRDILIEFDQETKEFIITDTEKILIPDLVNNEYLTPEQKERYRKGKEVEISDGTKLQFSGTERQGVRSNRLALVASIIVDGGVSYMLYQGLNALFGKKRSEKESLQSSAGYEQALRDMDANKNALAQYESNSRENLRKFSR